MKRAGVAFTRDDIEYSIELRDIYDGESVWVLKDGTRINRWASDDDATVPFPGFDRRFQATQEYLKQAAQEYLKQAAQRER